MEDPILKRGDEWIEKLTPKLPTVLSPSYWEDQLVQSLLEEIKKNREVLIEEVIVAEEKVIFKLPKELN